MFCRNKIKSTPTTSDNAVTRHRSLEVQKETLSPRNVEAQGCINKKELKKKNLFQKTVSLTKEHQLYARIFKPLRLK